MTNNNLQITAQALALVEALLSSLKAANALDGYFAREAGGAYGDIKKALITSLACAIATDSGPIDFGDARDIARCLYEEAINNWENIAYQIDLWNREIISL